jgi:hypothetical protein
MLLGFFVWIHHMYTTNIDYDTRSFFSIVTLLIGIPTGTKIYNYLTSYNLLTYLLPINILLPTNYPFLLITNQHILYQPLLSTSHLLTN